MKCQVCHKEGDWGKFCVNCGCIIISGEEEEPSEPEPAITPNVANGNGKKEPANLRRIREAFQG